MDFEFTAINYKNTQLCFVSRHSPTTAFVSGEFGGGGGVQHLNNQNGNHQII